MADPLRERIEAILSGLPERERETLLAFAEFLAERAGATPVAGAGRGEPAAVPEAPEVPQPKAIPRPDEESVIGALKRLSNSYYMLDKRKLFNETSALMNQHMLEGRPAADVIDELEALFERIYREHFGGGDAP